MGRCSNTRKRVFARGELGASSGTYLCSGLCEDAVVFEEFGDVFSGDLEHCYADDAHFRGLLTSLEIGTLFLEC